MKLYRCLVNDGTRIFGTFTAAKNKTELMEVCGGNGEFERVQDVTKEYFTETSPEVLRRSLMLTGWGEAERELISALLEEHLRKIGKM